MFDSVDDMFDYGGLVLLLLLLVVIGGYVHEYFYPPTSAESSTASPAINRGLFQVVPPLSEQFSGVVDADNPVIHMGQMSVVVVRVQYADGGDGLRVAIVINRDAVPGTKVICAPYNIPSVFYQKMVLDRSQNFVTCQAK